MTSVFASRRRAEEFNSLVEAPRSGAPRSGRDAHLEEFLSIVESLRAVPAPEPRPEFVASLRAELMAAADTLLVPATDDRLALPARNPRRDRRLAAAIGGLAVVGAGTSMAVAAQSALPGEMLYPLKRVIEDARTGVASERRRPGALAARQRDQPAGRGPRARPRGRADRRGRARSRPPSPTSGARPTGRPTSCSPTTPRPATATWSGSCATSPAPAWTPCRAWSPPCPRPPATSCWRQSRSSATSTPGPVRPARAAAAPGSTRSRRCCSPRPPPTARSW